jgi:hypothetical protein
MRTVAEGKLDSAMASHTTNEGQHQKGLCRRIARLIRPCNPPPPRSTQYSRNMGRARAVQGQGRSDWAAWPFEKTEGCSCQAPGSLFLQGRNARERGAMQPLWKSRWADGPMQGVPIQRVRVRVGRCSRCCCCAECARTGSPAASLR